MEWRRVDWGQSIDTPEYFSRMLHAVPAHARKGSLPLRCPVVSAHPARAVRELADGIEQQPQSMIRGKPRAP